MPNSIRQDPPAHFKHSAEATVVAACSKLFQTTLNSTDTLCVALSGGLDSMVLLDAAARLRASFDFKLIALHVNHQLSSNASDWANFCQQQCEQREIPLSIALLSLNRPKGVSLEALAREARYAEFANVNAEVIAVAQHLDDQSETLILRLLRGAGVRGLSAMASVRKCGTAKIIRPLLDLPRERLERYAQERNLQWIEDESNASLQFDRNYLRHNVLPQLATRFPGYRGALARSAAHAAEAESLLQQLGALDLAGAVVQNRLHCTRLRELSPARAKNALRVFLQGLGIEPPSSVRVAEIVRQLTDARRDANVDITLGGHRLRRFRDELWVTKTPLTLPQSVCVSWRGEKEVVLPQLGGTLHFRHAKGEGLRAMDAPHLTICLRKRNQTFQPHCKRPHRSLKNLFQEANIPPWQRSRLPFIYAEEILVAIPYLGVACDHKAGPDEDGWLIEWQELATP